MQHAKHHLKFVGEQFQVPGAWAYADPYGTGHINDTYLVIWESDAGRASTIQQRINHAIFKNPPELMDNILRVTAHLQQQLQGVSDRNTDRETLRVIPTRDGQPYYQDANGNFWRMYEFVQNAQTVDVCTLPAQAYEAALAFGKFQACLADLPGGRLHETIPFFHHTPRRFAALEDAILTDPSRRAASARREIDFCMSHKPLAPAIVDLLASGRIPERIAHNDTKINNVMIDNRTGRGVCVIDLDTVMSGCALYDFGDMARTMPRTTPEDEQDLSKVTVDLAMFEALTRGYMEGARSFLTPAEIENLVIAGEVITFTIGIRFLTDYLLGDVYFKTHRPGHNLDRARVQFKMVASMEEQADTLNAVVRKYA
jgi:hypothetical protein